LIKPSEIKNAFKKVEDENYKFRTYLKIHADSEELDRQFHELHTELFQNYDCSKCRNCCREYSATFTEEEICSAASYLGMTKEQFMDKHIKIEYGEYNLKQVPCCFLEDDGSCELGDCKPVTCEEYPFTDRSDRLGSLLNIVHAAGVCPVVFEMLERLKREYGFRSRRK
jgi:uncharacterized protein